MFKQTRNFLISILILFLLAYFLISYQLPYYIYNPGSAEPLDEIVHVENGFESEGDMHLVTVSGIQATPLQFIIAKFQTFSEIVPLENVRPKGMTNKEYRRYQSRLMDTSQHSSVVVAYEAANKTVQFQNNGIIVIHVVENMPSEGILEMGDIIRQVDDVTIEEAQNLIDYINERDVGDIVEVHFERDGKSLTKEITLEAFPDDVNKKGIGIQLLNDTEVIVDPPVTFTSKGIGGPSAGLMFALEMYDQLTEEDLTSGYLIAGTGEIDFEGNVHRIGGVDKKVVAAHNRGVKIFFAPNEEGSENSNYVEAKRAAEKINTDMQIVPVDTFEEALEFLQSME